MAVQGFPVDIRRHTKNFHPRDKLQDTSKQSVRRRLSFAGYQTNMHRSFRVARPLALHAAPALRRAPSQLRACTGGADRAATTRSISDAEEELKRASKVVLGTIAPSLRDAIDVETVSKAMLGKLCAEDTILKLKNPEGITVRAASVS